MKRLIIFTSLLCPALVLRAQFTNSGNIKLFSGAEISFYGDVTNNGTLIDSGLTVNLAGSDPQTLGGSSVTTFNNLTINNTHTGGVTLNQNMNVRGVLTLTDGYLNTTSAALLTLTSAATVSGAGNASFVSGPMTKTGDQAFVFPVGKNAVYAPIAISAPALITDQFNAEYFEANPDPAYDVTSKEVSLDHVSQCEYWTLNQTAGTSAVTVNLSWDTRSCGVDYLPDLRVARWDGTEWKDEGNSATTGTTAAGTVESLFALTAFGPFTLGSISGSNILPIELTGFEGYCDGTNIVITWSTASEMNNDYFTLERSTDGINWQVVKSVNGAGNSAHHLFYSITDEQRLSGYTSYYRLRQTDYNGFSEYLEPIAVGHCANDDTEKTLAVYPNPSSGKFNLVFSEDWSTVQSIEVFNQYGKLVNYTANESNSIDLTGEARGIYFIRLNQGNNVITQTITIE